MEGDKWKVKQDCNTKNTHLKTGDVLTEKKVIIFTRNAEKSVEIIMNYTMIRGLFVMLEVFLQRRI